MASQYVVIGAGNMGCVYGANLARIGARVAMIDVWPDHVDQIRRYGLRMDGLHGAFTVRIDATTDVAGAPKADVALVCVNSYATKEAAASAQCVLKDTGFVLTLQNGLGNVEVLSEVLSEGRILAGLSFHSGELTAPGRVTHTNSGPTYLGEINGARSARVAELFDLLDQAGMEPVVEDDIIATMWAKFVHNCGINAVCAATGLLPAEIRAVPEVDDLQSHIVEEVLTLLRAKGIRLCDVDPLKTIKDYCSVKKHRVSMVQHLKRGQRTEIDALNGYVVRESRKLCFDAPYNDALVKLIRGVEHSRCFEDDSRAVEVGANTLPSR